MSTPKRKAFSYIRFSHPSQAAGDSYDRQHRLAVAYCKENNLDLVSDTEYTFFDRGRSAFHGKNVDATGELRRFLNLVEDKSIPRGSVLIVESLDRLSRQSVKEALPRFMDLLNAGITIHSLNDKRTYTEDYDQFDLFQSIIEMARSHSESSNKSIRLREKWEEKHKDALTGKPLGKTKPAWLDLTGNPSMPYDFNENALVVCRIFELTLAGYGKPTVARMLNEDGYPSFKGKTWGMSSVDQILRSPTVLGVYQPMTGKGSERIPRGDPILDYYPPLLDKSTFDSARAAVDGRFRVRTGKQSARFQVWQGIAKCQLCGSPMHTFHKGSKGVLEGYLRCSSALKGVCPAKRTRVDESEQFFKEMLAKLNILALVQHSSSTIAANLEATVGQLVAEREKLAEYRKAYQKRRSDTVLELIYEAEDTITRLEAMEASQQAELAADEVVDKEDFFARLDLTSYAGRARANGILKRLSIDVGIDTATPTYHVRKAGQPQFDMYLQSGKIAVLPHTPELFEAYKKQDLVTLDGVMKYNANKRRKAAEAAGK